MAQRFSLRRFSPGRRNGTLSFWRHIVAIWAILAAMVALYVVNMQARLASVADVKILTSPLDIAIASPRNVVSFAAAITKSTADLPPPEWRVPPQIGARAFKVRYCESKNRCRTWTAQTARMNAWQISAAVLARAEGNSETLRPADAKSRLDGKGKFLIWNSGDIYTIVAMVDPSGQQLIPIRSIKDPWKAVSFLESGSWTPDEILSKDFFWRAAFIFLALAFSFASAVIAAALYGLRRVWGGTRGQDLRRRLLLGLILTGPALFFSLVPELAVSPRLVSIAGGSGIVLWMAIMLAGRYLLSRRNISADVSRS